MKMLAIRTALFAAIGVVLAACSGSIPAENIPGSGNFRADPEYAEVHEGYITVPAVDARFTEPPNRRVTVDYRGGEAPGTIIVDPYAKFLYFVSGSGTAIRYPIAVGREGKGFRGEATIGLKREWPSWTPTANMIRSEPEIYGPFAKGIPGGRASPLGARALYLYRGGRDTYFRIHGTNDPATIGNAGSAGCIRLFNQDVIDLYSRASVGARVIVRTYEQSVAAEGYEMANRGSEIVPRQVDPEAIYATVAAEERERAEYEAGL